MIVNAYEQLRAAVDAGYPKEKTLIISYARNGGRSVLPAWWSVGSPFFKTNPDGAWYEYGRQTFSLGFAEQTHSTRKASALKKAQEWAATKYGVTEWAKNRMGDYIPKEVNDKWPIPREKAS